MLRIGIIGRGAIGNRIQEFALAEDNVVLSGVLARSETDGTRSATPIVFDVEKFIALGHDVVVECAGQAALTQFGPLILSAGAVLVPASVGAFAQPSVLEAHLTAAAKAGSQVRLASGAIGGLDAIAAAAKIGLSTVKYTGLIAGAAVAGDEHTALPDRQLIFSGSAREAALKYPKHANLTVTIALIGIGLDATQVDLYRDRTAAYNVHQLHASGTFGRLDVTSEGRRITPSSPSSTIVPPSLFNAATGSFYLQLR